MSHIAARFSTADIASQHGRVFIITGGTAGIGLETATVLTRKGAHVIITARNEARGQEAVEHIRKTLQENKSGEAVVPHGVIEYGVLDNAKIETVQSFVHWFNKRGLPLHVLMLNAGVGFKPYSAVKGTEEGMLVNHLSHFYLTTLLLPNLESTAKAAGLPTRVVVVSSSAYAFVPNPVDWAARFTLPVESYDPLAGYSDTKLANLQFALELSRRLQLAKIPVLVNALHPGTVETSMKDLAFATAKEKGINVELLGVPVSLATGALTQLYVATSPDISQPGKEVTGVYFVPTAQREEIGAVGANAANARELWLATEARLKHQLTADA